MGTFDNVSAARIQAWYYGSPRRPALGGRRIAATHPTE